MLERSRFLGRLIGLYILLVSVAMMSHRQATLEAVAGVLRNPSMTLALGLVTVAAGLALVLGHNRWSGGALPVLVTVVGWLSLLKGLLLLALPPGMGAELLLKNLHYPALFYPYAAIDLLLGGYLTYSGFAAKAAR